MGDNNNKKAIGICSIVFALLIAAVGLVLGIVGLCVYEQKTIGWKLSLIGTCISAANSITGFILSCTGVL